jgi:hypothetical protein
MASGSRLKLQREWSPWAWEGKEIMFKAILGSIKNAEPKQCGYDHNWMFNNSGDLKALAPQVSDPDLAEHDRGSAWCAGRPFIRQTCSRVTGRMSVPHRRIGIHLLASRKENPGVATAGGGCSAFRLIEPQIRSRSQFRYIGMRRTLSLLAINALILFPASGQAGDIGDKAEDVIRGIGRGFSDVAHDVKQAVAGHDVDVSLGETHMEMPTSVDAGAVTFKVTNVGTEERGFKVSGPGLESSITAPLPPGATEKLTVNLKPGVYQVESPAQGDPTRTLAVPVTAVSSQ